jgi:uncharacterized protein YodC (DUF2158 family)
MSYAPGAVVKLHSGGPLMTVVEMTHQHAVCVWFSTDGLLQTADLPLQVITTHVEEAS